LAGAAGAAVAAGAAASAGFASSFFGAFLAFFAFLAGFAGAALSATGGWPAGIAAGAAAGSAAQTMLAKETATRAATMVENTFFMGDSPFDVVLLLLFFNSTCCAKKYILCKLLILFDVAANGIRASLVSKPHFVEQCLIWGSGVVQHKTVAEHNVFLCATGSGGSERVTVLTPLLLTSQIPCTNLIQIFT
jgi:hypothetical protein